MKCLCTIVAPDQHSTTVTLFTDYANISSSQKFSIRASVDALCRDDTGQISRDPRKNCLKTRRERLPNPSKQTKSHSRVGIQLSTCRKTLYVAPVLCVSIRSHAISRILCHHHHHHHYSSSSSVNPLSRGWNKLTG